MSDTKETGKKPKLKSSCCEKYLRKAKACSRCPVMAPLGKKKRKKRLKKIRKQLARQSRGRS